MRRLEALTEPGTGTEVSRLAGEAETERWMRHRVKLWSLTPAAPSTVTGTGMIGSGTEEGSGWTSLVAMLHAA
jgi:hypothetical protein